MTSAEQRNLYPGGFVLGTLLSSAVCGCGSDSDLVIGRQAVPVRCATDASATEFCPILRDELDSLDPAIWKISVHSFDENLANFMPENARLAGGRLGLFVEQRTAETPPPTMDPAKAYTAAEVGTVQSFLYGRFLARARFAAGSGVVSSVFGFHDYFVTDAGATQEWNELVVEGTSNPAKLRYSANRKDLLAADAKGTRDGYDDPPPFDPSASFHDYGFEWTPSVVRFTVDGIERFNLPADWVHDMRLPKRFLMSAYPSAAAWHSAFDPAALPVYAEYDWVEISEYIGELPEP